MDAYIRHGRISHGLHDDMLDDALTAAAEAEAQGRVVLLAAADRRTVNELNARSRAEHVRTGTVRTTGITLSDGLTGGVGDRIVTRRNNRRLRTSDGFVRNCDLSGRSPPSCPTAACASGPPATEPAGRCAFPRRTSPSPSSSATPPPPPAAKA
ncbi:hypothetical protein [Cellulomonas chitinilytica]|uniref:hypothetical protein n=1 Tax=Cellulomonas chitinilytica TaxID=398759 RepID=UPI001945AF2C|nr:hypothetical protein [Cellulomonas chitinilytica]